VEGGESRVLPQCVNIYLTGGGINRAKPVQRVTMKTLNKDPNRLTHIKKPMI
jgi:hypothetical protein